MKLLMVLHMYFVKNGPENVVYLCKVSQRCFVNKNGILKPKYFLVIFYRYFRHLLCNIYFMEFTLYKKGSKGNLSVLNFLLANDPEEVFSMDNRRSISLGRIGELVPILNRSENLKASSTKRIV